ncbi:Uncharacterized protein Adt_32162 [Abeliophyllum distichum]|uniref:Ribonuclease H1 N-terminal domain-containing protein n=1 Tax=Abeliophyllum distichum TaxID=126358 RepID=A0ABD1RHD2_9LAMI
MEIQILQKELFLLKKKRVSLSTEGESSSQKIENIQHVEEKKYSVKSDIESGKIIGDKQLPSEKEKIKSDKITEEKIQKETLISIAENIPCPNRQQDIQSPQQEQLFGINTSFAGTKFYVIYDGPHRGYYTNWTQVEPLVKNKPFKHKSFKTYTEAQQSFDDFHMTKGQSPIPFKQLFDHSQLVFSPSYIQKDIRARPRMPQFRPPISDNLKATMSYKTATTSSNPQRVPDRFKVLGKIPERKEDFIITDIRLQDFITLQEEARTIGETAPEKNYLRTLDKKYGQFIFLEGADPLMVRNAFHCGLIKMIIPGPIFEELKLVDDKLLQSLKDFRKYVIKSQATYMILRINSTIPFWDEHNILVRGYHHIQIKTTKQVVIDQPIEGQAHYVSPILLEDWRSLSFQRLITGLKFFNGESKIKVNHTSKFILMTSKTSSTISSVGIKAVCKFEESFYNRINTPTEYNGHLCPALRSSLGKYHGCELCKLTEKTEESKGKEKEGVDDFVDAQVAEAESHNSPADSAYQSD